MKSYDLIWIGTGQATGHGGCHTASQERQTDRNRRGRVGGTCVNYGCTPTKTLVASARRPYGSPGPTLAYKPGEIAIDFAKVMARMNKIRNNNSEELESWLTGLDGVDFYRAYASFEDAHRAVGEESIYGETIVVHTGARARKPPLPGLDEVAWLDNVRLLHLQKLPEHLVILGGSYIQPGICSGLPPLWQRP
ncbi:MAG: FAD-dependent oxidoreductase [Caldilineaceae bacterium]